MATINLKPIVGGDDGYWDADSFASADGASYFGLAALDANPDSTFIRFPAATIPSGSIISAASISFVANETSSSALDAEILAVAEDNASAPISTATANALTLTSPVSWSSVPSWTAGSTYVSPDISAAVQAVIDRSGWVDGNALVIVIRGVSASSGATRAYKEIELGAGVCPVLSITYDPPPTVGDNTFPLLTIDASDNTGTLGVSLPATTLYATDSPGYLIDTLPAISCAVTGETGEVGTAAIALTTLTAGAIGINDSAINTLPLLLISASTGAGGTSALPLLTLSASTGAGGTNTLPALSIDAYGGGDGTAANTLPLLGAQASGAAGAVSAASGTIPALVLDAYAGNYALLEIPIMLEAGGIAGNVASATIQTPALTLGVAATQEGVGVADLTAPRITLSASGLAENDGAVSEVLRPIRLVSSGVIGYAGQVSIELPGILLSATAYANNTATADNDTPAWYIDAEAFSAIAEAYRAWALNVRNAALTEYSGMAFNSFGVFQGRVLAAGATGLHVVGEADLDNTTNIAALVRTATTDFGTSYNKRVPRAYVGMKATQDMEFRTITSQDGARAYLIPRNGNADVQQRRAPIGRGPKARFWQFELANRDGGDFTAIDILVYPEVSNRRVV